MVKAKIGSGPEEIGAIIPSEASPLGPMSFALGKEEKDLSPGSIESRFILEEKIFLLDSEDKKSLYILDSKGKNLKYYSFGRQKYFLDICSYLNSGS